jgi:prevent-host-death family protein
VLRRAEAGEEFTVTVAGRPVARLGPAHPREWVGGQALQRVWRTPAPQTLDDDLAKLRGEISDVFAE